jgi:tRNA (cmo5U34)-methyltransferase
MKPPLDRRPQKGKAGGMSEGHFDPATYREWIRQEIPQYDELQGLLAVATTGVTATRILDLGTGTGETLSRVLTVHPGAQAIGLDESAGMLEVARSRLAEYDVSLHVADLLDPLPEGPFDLVVSALAVHHLDGPGKATLFGRVASVLSPGGRFVLADVVLLAAEAVAEAEATVPLTEDYDKPSPAEEQVEWMEDAGLRAQVSWQEDDLALFIADRPAG